jgi:hypothetical protein
MHRSNQDRGRCIPYEPQSLNKTRTSWTACALIAATIMSLHFAGTAHAADLRASGPRALIITYHTTPANRVAFRRQLEDSAVRLLRRGKLEGVLQSYHMLYNRYVDSDNWDAMALLTFATESGLERWKEIEREAPAGLSPQALALVTSIDTAPADLMRQDSAPQPQSAQSPVFLVIPYEYLVPLDEYVAYLDGYVVPQMDGWMQEGVLARYGIYLARYPAGRPWQSLLVLEYRSDQALGARDATVAAVRARLKDNAQWQAISEGKKRVRVEKPPVIADVLASR